MFIVIVSSTGLMGGNSNVGLAVDKEWLVTSGLSVGPPLLYWPAPHNKLNSWLLYGLEGL